MNRAEDQSIITRLRGYGIHITKTRITVLKMLLEHKGALSVAHVNKYFSGSLDRVSIYRAFKAFLQKGLILKVPNSDGEVKYILKPESTTLFKSNKNAVAYFVCSGCGTMSVFKKMPVRTFKLPNTLLIQRCHIIIEGVCAECIIHSD